ncbi:MAG: sensor histidine kinase [Chloroflexi bacterium]|nr:sensor histidine kinase [Chloroflexota bacterium]
MAPTQGPIYAQTAARLVAAFLLALGALVELRTGRVQGQRRATVLFLPSVILVILTAMFLGGARGLPVLVDLPILLDLPALDPAVRSSGGSPFAGTTPEFLALHFSIGAVYLLGAVLFRRLFIRQSHAITKYVSLGLVFASFSQIHFALYPSTYTSVVGTADLLRVAFYATLLFGIEIEARDQLRALRQANVELEDLREVDVARAGLEERARLAREVHDGLAQELWFAKLKQARLTAMPDLPGPGRELGEEVSRAIDNALAEARQAVMAMRSSGDELDAAFPDVLRRYVDDFDDRFGIRAEFHSDTPLPPLRPRTQAELLRIVQEALNNVQKHADATVVNVNASADSGRLVLTVTDNGRGFDPANIDGRRFGMQSMRERAQLVGGTVSVQSQPHDGARVTVDVPLDAAAEVSP